MLLFPWLNVLEVVDGLALGLAWHIVTDSAAAGDDFSFILADYNKFDTVSDDGVGTGQVQLEAVNLLVNEFGLTRGSLHFPDSTALRVLELVRHFRLVVLLEGAELFPAAITFRGSQAEFG